MKFREFTAKEANQLNEAQGQFLCNTTLKTEHFCTTQRNVFTSPERIACLKRTCLLVTRKRYFIGLRSFVAENLKQPTPCEVKKDNFITQDEF